MPIPSAYRRRAPRRCAHAAGLHATRRPRPPTSTATVEGRSRRLRSRTLARAFLTAVDIFLVVRLGVVVVLWVRRAGRHWPVRCTPGSLVQFVLLPSSPLAALGELSQVVGRDRGGRALPSASSSFSTRSLRSRRRPRRSRSPARRAEAGGFRSRAFPLCGAGEATVLDDLCASRVAAGRERWRSSAPPAPARATVFALIQRFYDPLSGARPDRWRRYPTADPRDAALAHRRSCRRTP